jgi:hypothetical protein
MYIKPAEPVSQEEIAAKIERIQQLLAEAYASHPLVRFPKIRLAYSKNTDKENTSESIN